jgi:vacuolar-type H+-ATPase subunit H
MSNFKDQAKDKIDDAAKAAKKTAGKAVDKAKDLTHKAGESVEKGGKRLRDV